MEKTNVIAISFKSFELYGCPYCGYRSGYTPVFGGGSTVFECGECRATSVLLADNLSVSSIGLCNTTTPGNPTQYPKLQEHPRKGIASHGNADPKPKNGGEFFRSRGIGLDQTPGCFVCGGNETLHANISGFVNTKEAGERVVAMFDKGARLDFRLHEPDRIQVKIGACNNHRKNLEKLDELIKETTVITADMIILSKT